MGQGEGLRPADSSSHCGVIEAMRGLDLGSTVIFSIKDCSIIVLSFSAGS